MKLFTREIKDSKLDEQLNEMNLGSLLDIFHSFIKQNAKDVIAARKVVAIENGKYQRYLKEEGPQEDIKNQWQKRLMELHQMLEGAENMLSRILDEAVNNYLSQNPDVNNEIANNMMNIANRAIRGIVKDDVKQTTESQQKLYPKYTPEQIITAFFSYKFSTREDIKNFFGALNKQIVDEEKVKLLNVDDVLVEEDLQNNISVKPTAYNADDILALETSDIWSMLTPYREGSRILSNARAEKYDRQQDRLLGDTFADCSEIAIRHLLNFFLYDEISHEFNLDRIVTYVKLQDPENAYIKNFIDFYSHQKPDLANDGSIRMRSLWNRVVGDMNRVDELESQKITYVDGRNELETGYINLKKVFKKLFSLPLDPTPAPQDSFEKKKAWLAKSFSTLFTALNPDRKYELDFRRLRATGDPKAEISDTMVVTVKNKINLELYRFDFDTTYGQHSEINNFKIMKDISFVDYSRMLIQHPNDIAKETAEEIIWFLSKNADLRNHKQKKFPALYQFLSEGLNSNTAKLRFLEKVDEQYGVDSFLVSTPAFKVILKNVMGDLSFDDAHTLNQVAPVMLSLSKREGVGEIVAEALRSVKIGGEYSNLNAPAFEFLCKALKVNKTLTSLNINYNKIDADPVLLAEALKENTTLASLSFIHNKIGDEGVTHLAEALKVNTTLRSLNLGRCEIGDQGVLALANALVINKTLKLLDLSSNVITSRGVYVLAELLKVNTTLTSLALGDNKTNHALYLGANYLAEALKVNTTLTSLDLSHSEIRKNKRHTMKAEFGERVRF